MSNNYTQYSVDVSFKNKAGVKYAKAKLDAMFAQKKVFTKDPDGDPDDANCTFYADWSDRSQRMVTIWHDEYGRVDHAAEFIKVMMVKGHVLEPIVLEWSNHDDGMAGAQSGGAVLITKDKLYWFVPNDLAMRKWRNIEKRRERLK